MSVTQAEIIAFRTSITARRFPALREMRDEDLAALVLANKKAQSKKPAYEQREDFDYTTLGPREEPLTTRQAAMYYKDPVVLKTGPRPPFAPANTAQAKSDIARKGAEPFLNSSAPLEGLHTRDSMRLDDSKPFKPSSASQAKDLIMVNYYLNSPDQTTQESEKEFIQQRALKNSEKLVRSGYGRVGKPGETLAADEPLVEDVAGAEAPAPAAEAEEKAEVPPPTEEPAGVGGASDTQIAPEPTEETAATD